IEVKLSQSSWLVDVVNKIQTVFNQQAERAIVSKYKNEIPTKGMPNIMKEYFPELNKLLHDYLSLQIFQKQHDQISQSLCYDKKLHKISANKLDQLPSQLLQFNHLVNIRKTTHIVQKQNPKQKYSFRIGYAKKALNYAVQINKVDKFINYLEKFIKIMKSDLERQQENINDDEYLDIDDPIYVRHKGCQPNHYKSEGEGSSKKKIRILHDNMANQILNNNNSNNELNQNVSNSNPKCVRHCYKCKQAGHYASTYLNL
ncbi:15940_t:CDS:2, partial [Cetraspora pellucida]